MQPVLRLDAAWHCDHGFPADTGADQRVWRHNLARQRVPGLFHILEHAGITLEVGIHIALCFSAGNIQLACQPKAEHAIDKTEVNRLGPSALLWSDSFKSHIKDFSRRCSVNIFTLGECRQQAGILGQVSMILSSICE